MFIILTYLILMLVAAFCAITVLNKHKKMAEPLHFFVRIFALSGVFIVLYAAAHVIFSHPQEHAKTFLQMMENLVLYTALPFIATLFLALSREWYWSMAAWGRWFLCLIAAFELARRGGWGVHYSHTLFSLITLTLLAACWGITSMTARYLLFIGTLFCTAALLCFSPFALLQHWVSASLFNLTLGSALVCFWAALDKELCHRLQLSPPSSLYGS